MNISDLLKTTVDKRASDLHIGVGLPPMVRINGKIEKLCEDILSPEDSDKLVKELLDEKQLIQLQRDGEIDSSFSLPGLGRFRMNAFKQRGSLGVAIRSVPLHIPSIEDLGLPSSIKELAHKKRGLILVTGPTGSGKSTTLASMIDYINKNRSCHILTLEDPIEYLHKHNQSMVNQREVGRDTLSFSKALRAALRQDPDVILVGEMRDLETISIALTAAETGHLVLSTLHTVGAAKTIDRIIDIFPPNQQQQVKVQLATVLEGVISQQLIEKIDGDGRAAALEVMTSTPAIRNLIREGKTHQINTNIQTGKKFGMQTMDDSLINLYNDLIIEEKNVYNFSVDMDYVKRYLRV